MLGHHTPIAIRFPGEKVYPDCWVNSGGQSDKYRDAIIKLSNIYFDDCTTALRIAV